MAERERAEADERVIRGGVDGPEGAVGGRRRRPSGGEEE